MNSKTVHTNNINIHYLENETGGESNKETVILLHGLTANAHSFSSIAGKMNNYHTVSVDLRGRGLSDKPDNNYSMADHAKDIIGLMDNLDINKCIVAGHSFGAKLSIFLAVEYPERFSKIILIDIAEKLPPDITEIIMPSIMRLEKTWDSFDDYLAFAKKAPYFNGHWSDEYMPFLQADVKELAEGKITTRANMQQIVLAIEGSLDTQVNWKDFLSRIEQETILINAPGAYANGVPLIAKKYAMETVNMMKNCKYQHVSGNHITMLFEKGAEDLVNAIINFIKN